jgi:hypothetical protein
VVGRGSCRRCDRDRAAACGHVVWGLWIAPRARRRLRDPLRFAVESVVWAGAVAALVLVDRVGLAIGFGVVAFASALLARRFEPAMVNAS